MGAGTLEHLVEGLRDGQASALLAAWICHFGRFRSREANAALKAPASRGGVSPKQSMTALPAGSALIANHGSAEPPPS